MLSCHVVNQQVTKPTVDIIRPADDNGGMMKRRSVIISTFVLLSVGLIAVPSIGLLFKGCKAGTRGLLDWLPELWEGQLSTDRPCEPGNILQEGYKALCPAVERRSAIKDLLDNIGFFGPFPNEEQELAICQYSKSAWTWLANKLVSGRDAILDLHHAVDKALAENTISVENLLELFMDNASYGIEHIWTLAHKAGRQVSLPILNIPDQFNKQYSQLWQFYASVRKRQSVWTSRSSYSNATIVTELSGFSRAVKAGNWKYVKKGYLSPAWRYITCAPAKTNVKRIEFKLDPLESKPSVISGGVEVSSVRETEAAITTVVSDQAEVANDDWESVTRGYVTKLINIVRNSPGEGTVMTEPEEAPSQKEDTAEAAVVEEDADSSIEVEKGAEESKMDIPELEKPPHENQIAQNDQTQGTGDVYTRSVKKVLLESLIATVCAFSLFILGVAFHWLMRSKSFGFKWPSLAQLVINRYKPVRLIESTAEFNTFQMVCRRTKQTVAVKCLQSASTSSARAEFSTELQTLKRIRHPNIISLMDCIRSGPRFCLGVEYAAYGNLKEAALNPAKPFVFYHKIMVYRQILEAVSWMHKSGWAHLNIRPGSVMVFDQWSMVKLSGFTSAVEYYKGELGCDYNLHPMCASPQVIIRQPYDPVKADLWALGCLLYFVFTLREIQDSEGALRLARVVSRMDYERGPGHRLNLLKLLADLLAIHPDNRPQLVELIDTINKLADYPHL